MYVLKWLTISSVDKVFFISGRTFIYGWYKLKTGEKPDPVSIIYFSSFTLYKIIMHASWEDKKNMSSAQNPKIATQIVNPCKFIYHITAAIFILAFFLHPDLV